MGFKSQEVGGVTNHNLLDGSVHPDTVGASVLQGDLIFGNATPKWDRLPIGANGKVLQISAGLPVWEDLPVFTAQSYFLTNTASDIATYKVMQVAIPGGGGSTVTATVTGTGTLIQSWATPTGFPGTTFIPAGTWHIHCHASKSGPGTKDVVVFVEIYKRAVGGAETLLGTSEESVVLTTSEVEHDVHAVIGDTLLLTTDRIVAKYKGTVSGAGTNPDVTLYFDGTTASRLDLPVSLSALDHGTLIGLGDDDHTQYHTDARAATWLGTKSIADLGTKTHSLLTSLSADDHTQYALLAGRAGGQTLYGGNAANDDLIIEPTSHATKTSAFVMLCVNGGLVGINNGAPAVGSLDIKGQSGGASPVIIRQSDGAGGLAFNAVSNFAGFSLGSYWSGAAWTALLASAALFYKTSDGYFAIYGDTGLTPGNTFTPTKRYIFNLASTQFAIGFDPPSAGLTVNGGCHIGGTTDPGDNNLLADGTIVATGGFGCNSKTAQTAYASGGALAAYATGSFGLDSDAHMHSLYDLVVAIRAALVANGIMS